MYAARGRLGRGRWASAPTLLLASIDRLLALAGFRAAAGAETGQRGGGFRFVAARGRAGFVTHSRNATLSAGRTDFVTADAPGPARACRAAYRRFLIPKVRAAMAPRTAPMTAPPQAQEGSARRTISGPYRPGPTGGFAFAPTNM